MPVHATGLNIDQANRIVPARMQLLPLPNSAPSRKNRRRLTIKTGAIIFGCVVGAGLLVVILAGQIALWQLKVGGPLYERVATHEDLVTDLMSSPEYIVESYLEVALSLEKLGDPMAHRNRLAELHRQYEDRRRYWLSQPISQGIKDMLVKQSDIHVQKFWHLTEDLFLPALARGDDAAAKSAFMQMRSEYEAHRSSLSRIVAAAEAESTKTKEQAARDQKAWVIITWLVTTLVVTTLAAGIAWLLISVIRPLSQIASSIRQISAHEYGTIVSGVGRSDEIGDVASATLALRNSLLETSCLRAELRSIFSAVGEGIFIACPNTGCIRQANEAGLAMFNVAATGQSELTIAGLLYNRAEEAQHYATALIEKVLAAGQVEHFNWEVIAQNGQTFWADITLRVAPISGQNEILIVVRNVTDRRTIETQLRQALKLQAIGTLAGGVAHELNNLLQPILMMTEMAMMEMPEGGEQAKRLERVLNAGIKASQIVRRILDFGRVDQEVHGTINLNKVVHEGVALVRAMLPSTIGITLDVGDDACNVQGDATQLTQLLINLATNARDAIGRDVGNIFITLSRMRVEKEMSITGVGSLKAAEYAVLQVEDSGVGMDAETVERIFEPFFTTKAVGSGTGLGLSVVRGIVVRHKGALQVKSALSKGTACLVYLPIDDSAQLQVPKEL
jgi:signal transduction histidine kinase